MRRTQLITTAALVAACAAPASAVAQTQDLRSPDARDAARAAEQPQDLRSPDARDAGRASQVSLSTDSLEAARKSYAYQDLRSPDARDVGRDLPPVQVAAPVVQVRSPSSGFDWGDAGIGAAGVLALFGIATGLMMGVVQARRRRDPQAIAH